MEREASTAIVERAQTLANARGEAQYVIESPSAAAPDGVVYGIHSLAFLDQRGIDVESAVYVAEPMEG